MTWRISRADLERFQETLNATDVDHYLGQNGLARWRRDLAFLLDEEVDVDDQPRFFPWGLEHAVLAVQDTGRGLFGDAYRHLWPI